MVDKQEYLEKFKKLFREKNPGKDITDIEALEHFEKLTALVSAVFKPIPISALENSKCPMCLGPIEINQLKDELTKSEFLISGLCQTCQNDIFKK